MQFAAIDESGNTFFFEDMTEEEWEMVLTHFRNEGHTPVYVAINGHEAPIED